MEKKGEKIEGSRYYRDFCAGCGEPMRVVRVDPNIPPYCEQCSPRQHRGCSSRGGTVNHEPDQDAYLPSFRAGN
jgi:hypothetical protein